jgi:hypothetical protein
VVAVIVSTIKKKATSAKVAERKITYMNDFILLPDQSQIEEEQPFRYTRRPIELEPPTEILGKCEFDLCGCLIYDGQDFCTYDNKTFCSQYHLEEYKEMESECEVA